MAYKGLTIEIGGNSLPLKRAVNEAASEVRVLASEARKLEKEFQFNPNLSNIQKIRNNYSEAIEKAKELSEAAQKRLDELMAKGADENDRNVQRLKTTINNAQKDIAVFNIEAAKLDKLEASGLKKTFEDTTKQVDLAKDKTELLRESLEKKFDNNVFSELQKAAQDEIIKTQQKLDLLKSTMSDLEARGEDKNSIKFKELENQVLALNNSLINSQEELNNLDKIKLEEANKQIDLANNKVGLLREKLEAKPSRNTLQEFLDASRSAADKTTEKLTRLKEIMAEMEKNDPAASQTAQFKDLQNQVISLETELIKVNKEIKDIGNVNLTRLGENIKKIGSEVENVGKSLLPLSATATAGLTMAAKAAIDYESAFAGVRKTVEATEEEYAQLSAQIKQMSEEIPLSAKEIAKIAETAGQLGIAKDGIRDFTQVVADLGATTNLAGSDGAEMLAQFANITKTPISDYSRLGSTIAALDVSSATSAKSITEMSMRLAGAGKQAGMTEAQILSLSAFLSSVGIQAEAGGSAISKLLMEMQVAVETGKGKLKDFADVAGMSGSQFQKAFKDDAASALFSFVQGLANAKEEGGSAVRILDEMGLSNIRMNDALLRSSSAVELFAEIMQTGNQAWEGNIALQDMAAEKYGTTESKLIMTKNALENTAASMAVPVITVASTAPASPKTGDIWYDLSNA